MPARPGLESRFLPFLTSFYIAVTDQLCIMFGFEWNEINNSSHSEDRLQQ